ncbi:MAG: O-antigen ligase family protein [Alphaproteobacteria bacterium]|nr:O-antigen ligase family protein [Alphaproteobacteria bacterium]
MVLRALLAILLTALFLVGRWNLQRLAVNPDAVDFDLAAERSVTAVLIEPRLWLVIACVILLVLIEIATSGDAPIYYGRPEARTGVAIFFVYSLYLAATIAWTPNDNPFPALVDICLMLVTLLVVERAARNPQFVEAFWLWLEVLLIAIGAFAVVAELFLQPPASSDLPGRLSILGGGPNILGRFLGMLCLLMVAQSLRQGGSLRWSVVWRVMVAAVTLILLLQTGSRGAMTGLVIGLLALLVLRRMDVRLIGIGLVVVVSFPYLFKAILNPDMVESVDERWLVATLQEGYLSARDVLLDEAYRIWLDRPIFGGGLDSFEYYTLGLDRYPHNLVMQMAQEGGIIAALLLFGWLSYIMVKSWCGRNQYTEIGLSMTALIFGCALFSGDFYDSRLMFVFGVLSVASRAGSGPVLQTMHEEYSDLGSAALTPGVLRQTRDR